VITDLDRIIDDPNSSRNAENINDVIQIRDILLITNLEIASIVGDKENYEFSTDNDLKDPNIIKDLSSNTLKNSFINSADIPKVVSTINLRDDFGSFSESQQVLERVIIGGGLVTKSSITNSVEQVESNENLNANTYKIDPIINSQISIIIVGSNVLKSGITQNLENSIAIVTGIESVEDLKFVAGIENLSVVVPIGVYSASQHNFVASAGVQDQDMNNFLTKGQLNLFNSEKINVVFSNYGIGNIGDNLKMVLYGLPDGLSIIFKI
jgi:hypothetical protein